MVYLAVRRGLVTPDEIASVATALGSVKGRAQLLSTVSAAAAGSESHLETIGLRSVFATKEFAGFIRQHRVRADGTHYRLDMYHPPTRTAVELDGAVAHDGESQRARDVRRDARLASVGIVTVRFTYRDLVDRPLWCRVVVARTLETRGSGRVGLSATSETDDPHEWC